MIRTVALDVHKRFAEVAVHEDGGLRRLGRIETGQLRTFAESLGPQDHVVLESTAMTWAIAELLARIPRTRTDGTSMISNCSWNRRSVSIVPAPRYPKLKLPPTQTERAWRP